MWQSIGESVSTVGGKPLETSKREPREFKTLAIAARVFMFRGGQFQCYSQKPANCRLYGINTDQPCWYAD